MRLRSEVAGSKSVRAGAVLALVSKALHPAGGGSVSGDRAGQN